MKALAFDEEHNRLNIERKPWHDNNEFSPARQIEQLSVRCFE